MAISAANAAKLNKMNKAAQNVSLGTILRGVQQDIGNSGSYTAVLADASASSVTLPSGLTAVVGYVVQGASSGSPLTLKIINSGSNLVATAGSAIGATPRAIGTGDTFNWVVW